MDAANLKLALLKSLLDTNDLDLLRRVGNILLPKKHPALVDPDEEIIGHEPDGSPISRKQMLKSIEESEGAISKGDVLSHEEVVKMAKDW